MISIPAAGRSRRPQLKLERDDRARNILCPVIFRFKFSMAMTIFTAAPISVLLPVGFLVVKQVQCAHFQLEELVKKNTNNYYPNHLKIKTRGHTSESVFNGVPPPHCILAVGFKMPNAAPISLTNWWCNHRHGICIRGLQLRYILL